MKNKLLALMLATVMLLSVLCVGMPASAATITYSDVDDTMWSYDDIMYVTENGLMNGTGGSSFSPTASLTRAMVVTVLYRLEGAPRTVYKDLFLDVEDRLYYSEAVVWAKLKGIVNATGTDEWGEEYFSPNRDITRQELATMFVRYAEYKHVITENTATLDKFDDKSAVADWASAALKWATSCSLINGTGNGDTLSPTGKATREQFAAIIHRFTEAEFDYEIAYAQPKVLSTYTEQPYPYVDDADVYVSVEGNDNNDGSITKPLATFEAAKAKVRELKKTAKDEIVVAFMEGDYGELNITFTKEDGGTEAVPVKYCKYGDGDVIFCNGVYIKESEFTLVEGKETEMFKKAVRDNIYKVDLSGRIDKFGFTTRLFTERGLGKEAREPNDGNYYTNMTTTVDPWSSIKLQLALPGVVEKLSSIDGMRINGYLRTGWMNDTFDVLSYDPETKVMVLDLENSLNDYWIKYPNYELMYEGRVDDQVFFSNLPEFIDENGEYWFDNKTSTLYVFGAKGDYSIDNGGGFVTIEEGAEYISFVGLEFNTTSASAIELYADNFTFDLGKIGNVGGKAAIHAPFYVKGLTVSNSEIYNCVDSCIYIFSEADGDDLVDGKGFWDITDNVLNLEEGNNVIINNYFHDFTLPNYFSSAVEVTGDVGTYIAHNYFYEGGHGGIRYNKSIGVTIEYNVFDRIMTQTYDYGAVYTCSLETFRDNVIRYNLFMNIPVYAVYLDAGTSGQEVYGNVFYETWHTIVQNAGRANVIHDNAMIYSYGGITSNHGRYSYIVNDNVDEFVLENDNMSKNKPMPGDPMYNEWYSRWPELYDFNVDPDKVGDPNCLFTPVTFLSNNASFGDPLHRSDLITEFCVGENNVDYKDSVNPIFVNPSIGDYRIRDDAGFFKIPYEKIGRY